MNSEWDKIVKQTWPESRCLSTRGIMGGGGVFCALVSCTFSIRSFWFWCSKREMAKIKTCLESFFALPNKVLKNRKWSAWCWWSQPTKICRAGWSSWVKIWLGVSSGVHDWAQQQQHFKVGKGREEPWGAPHVRKQQLSGVSHLTFHFLGPVPWTS